MSACTYATCNVHQEAFDYRETTVLEAKLEKLAALIGQIGLGAGLLAFGALASQFSWQKFVVEGQSWDWSFAPEYLRFLITSITILVCLHLYHFRMLCAVTACCALARQVIALPRKAACTAATTAICLAVNSLAYCPDAVLTM